MKSFGAFLLLVGLAVAELQPPYPPSGWKPAGQRLQLPVRARQQLPVPHTVYGAPSTPAPVPHTVYGPPSTEAPVTEPSFQYGPPANEYGSPVDEYGTPEDVYGQPNNEYGSPQQPANEYGSSQEPGNEYGGPEQTETEYTGPEEEGSGSLPLDPGATERVRQNQFIQQLPHYKPPNFRSESELQKLRQRPQKIQQHQARPKPQRLTTNVQVSKQPIRYVQTDYKTISDDDYKKFPSRIQQAPKINSAQRLPIKAAAPQFQRQQLYTTPIPNTTTQKLLSSTRKNKRTRRPQQPTNEDVDFVPNVAVSTAVAAEYYVLQEDGNVQKVTYTNKNGQVTGEITSNLRYEDIDPINPIYSINESNQLTRINK